MMRCWTFAVIAAIAVGSGGCSQQKTAESSPSASAAPESGSPSAEEVARSEQVIGQFLDRIRRGGPTNDAQLLLTDKAQSELARIGKPIQPIGSPDASFRITRSEAAPATSDSSLPARLVHCIWSEPNPDASVPAAPTLDYQVVWAVVRQPSGWRISGLVLEMSPEEPPLVLDFENGELMAQMLSANSAEQVAAGPAETTTR
ncbi:MAG: hypothetical protein AAGC97_06250 [Planctomycetota bacterium]